MTKNKRQSIKGIPTGEECIGLTNRCLLCNKRRANTKRIAEGRYESYHCRCLSPEGNTLSVKDGDKAKCTKPAINETTKCWRHGGAALRGEAHPRYKHGRYSKVIPIPLREAYEQSIGDEKLTHLREQISLCDAREMELLQQLPEGGIAKRLTKLDKAVAAMGQLIESAESKQDFANVRVRFGQLKREIDEVKHNEATWEKLHKNMEQRRALVETENKQKERLQGVVTPEMLLSFTTQLIRILKENISDRNLLNDIATRLRALGGGSAAIEQPLIEGEVIQEVEVVKERAVDPAEKEAMVAAILDEWRLTESDLELSGLDIAV